MTPSAPARCQTARDVCLQVPTTSSPCRIGRRGSRSFQVVVRGDEVVRIIQTCSCDPQQLIQVDGHPGEGGALLS